MEELFDTSKSILQQIHLPILEDRGVELFVKRDDLIHNEVSGNKWRKLKYNFQQFKVSKKKQIITFGGAYSNHLLATASACDRANVPVVGIVRGDELNSESNEVLKRCHELGMQLEFVSRMDYSMRYERNYHEYLLEQFPNSYIIPEGGANYYGIIGCQEILKEVSDNQFEHVFVAQGTSTTSCGIIMSTDAIVHVIPALKGYDSVGEMKTLLGKTGLENEFIEELMANVVVHDQFHFGGYGKWNEDLLQFINEMKVEHSLPLDKIYTGKAFFALMEAVKNKTLDNSRVLFIHTGGVFKTS